MAEFIWRIWSRIELALGWIVPCDEDCGCRGTDDAVDLPFYVEDDGIGGFWEEVN